MPKRRKAGTPPYTETTWTKTVNGVEYERVATSIDQEVQYQFDGWLPKGKSAGDATRNAAAAAAAAGSSTGGKPAQAKPASPSNQ